MTTWGNLYKIEFEQPPSTPGVYVAAIAPPPQKICALNITEAIGKAQAGNPGYMVASAELLISGVQW